jgi:hypothetical protein
MQFTFDKIALGLALCVTWIVKVRRSQGRSLGANCWELLLEPLQREVCGWRVSYASAQLPGQAGDKSCGVRVQWPLRRSLSGELVERRRATAPASATALPPLGYNAELRWLRVSFDSSLCRNETLL